MLLSFAVLNWDQVAAAIVPSATVSTLLALFGGWLFRAWATARIKNEVDSQYAHKLEEHKAALKAKYDRELEGYRAELKAQYDRGLEGYRAELKAQYDRELEGYRSELKGRFDTALEKFRADTAEQRALHTVATSALTATLGASTERRLKAVDVLWQAMFHGREVAQRALGFYEILTRDEIKHASSDPRISRLIRPIDDKAMSDFNRRHTEADQLRPYVDDVMWSYFYAHHFFFGRALALVKMGFEAGQMVHWYDDSGIWQILSRALTSQEQELVKKMTVGGLTKVASLLEWKFIQAAQETISGRATSRAALEQARRLLESVVEAESNAAQQEKA
jgi:hypothetical protein